MDFLSPEILALLFLVGLASGWVDAIAGGGGLIGLPVLIGIGLTPAQALATNKLQGGCGTFSASLHFIKKGHIRLKDIWPMILLTFIGAASGTLLVQSLDSSFLIDIIPFMLISVGIFFLLPLKVGKIDSPQKISLWGFSALCGFSIGFYDGFFGPGTGSFFAIAFMTLMGFNMLKATAHTKVLNFTSNVASLIFFAFGGQIVWIVGLVMAAGQLIGAYIGSGMTMKHGAKIIRPLLVIVSFAMTIKLVASTPDHIIQRWIEMLF
jgi:uncharacterized membrane protein YfcA